MSDNVYDDLAASCYLGRKYVKDVVMLLMYGGSVDPWLDAIVKSEMFKIVGVRLCLGAEERE